MFIINKEDLSISLTRGDIAAIEVSANNKVGETVTPYIFKVGDVVRIQVTEKGNVGKVVIRKDVVVDAETETVDILLETEDTAIGELINKPVNYWYEIELNPDTDPQTIIGYDNNGPKIFRLFPEGDDGAWA